MNIEWMDEICDRNAFRAILRKPWSITVDGKKWAISTNGQVLYAIKTENEFPYLIKEPNDANVILKGLTEKKGNLVTSVQALRDWVGPDTFEVCRACDEDGYRLNEIDRLCNCCDGNGYINGHEFRDGKIDDVLINRWLIAKAFHHLPDGSAHVVTNGPEGVVIFIGDDWRVMVMPLHYQTGNIEVVEFDAWNHCEEAAECN